MKRLFIVLVIFAFCMTLEAFDACAQGETKAAKPAPAPAKAPAQPAVPAQRMPRANFAIITGSITKIDTADPNNVKLEVVNDADKTTHTVAVTPWTNITKVTDITELKAGDTVRIMSRKVDENEVAMGVMFGKIKKIAPAAPAQAAPAAQAQAQPKQ